MSIIAQSRALVQWQPVAGVPIDGTYEIYSDDGQGGAVSYASPVNRQPIVAWPDGETKRGWGLGRWGHGAWGYGSGGAGWGYGPWGLGGWGYGTILLEWLSPLLADGTWTFAAIGFDAAGNPGAPGPATLTDSVALAGTPAPPGIPEADDYDDGTDTVTITWTVSPDDT